MINFFLGCLVGIGLMASFSAKAYEKGKTDEINVKLTITDVKITPSEKIDLTK